MPEKLEMVNENRYLVVGVNLSSQDCMKLSKMFHRVIAENTTSGASIQTFDERGWRELVYGQKKARAK